MSEERRSAPRARLSGARVTFESAIGGDRVEANALNLGRGGLFVLTEKPLPVGKRIALDIQVVGEPTSWPALGRVIWARERADGERKPAGMGVKLIDVEDEALETIERLVEVGDPLLAPGVEEKPAGLDGVEAHPVEPNTEDTLASLQAALASEPAIPVAAEPRVTPGALEARVTPVAPEPLPPAEVVATPIVSIVSAAPERERTIMGVGAFPSPPPKPSTPPPPEVAQETRTASEPPPAAAGRGSMRPREPSLAFELVHKERTPSTPPPRPRSEVRDEAPPQKAFAVPRASDPPPGPAARKGRGGGWLVVVLFLVIAAVAAYWLLGTDADHATRSSEPPAGEPSTSAPLVRLPPAPTESVATAATSQAPAPAASLTAGGDVPAAPSGPVPQMVGLPRRVTPFSPPAYAATNFPVLPGHGPAMPATGDGGFRRRVEDAAF